MTNRLVFNHGSLDDVYTVHQQVPEMSSVCGVTEYSKRIAGRKTLILIAAEDRQPVGFKLGFSRDQHRLYSWLGGVLPSHRRQGIAKHLLHWQETLVRDNGYSTLQVKSMNRFPNMLHLLISNGYLIEGYTSENGPQSGKIEFIKTLNQ